MHPRSHLLARALVITALLVPSVGHAATVEQAVDPPPRRLLAVEGAAGIGTPLGWTGASFVLRPRHSLAMHGGAGLGTNGIQTAFGARFITVRGLGLGASWSAGTHAGLEDVVLFDKQAATHPRVSYWRRAHFLNLDVSLELGHHGGWHLRPFAGIGFVLNGGSSTCVNVRDGRCEPPLTSRIAPYLGLAVAFEVL